MPEGQIQKTNQGTQKFISFILIAGLVVSTVLVIYGGVLYLTKSGNSQPQYHTFKAESSDLNSVKGIIALLHSGNPQGIMQTGLLILMLTPVARVIFALLAFAHERDYTYVIVAGIVLGVLCFSIIAGGL
jgi:uncharacterized membrane protein